MRIDPKRLDGIFEPQLKKNTNSIDNSGNKDINKESKIKKDRVELSKDVKDRDEVSFIVANVVSEIEKGAGAEKLHELKTRINNGTYRVSSEDIAEAMIKPKK